MYLKKRMRPMADDESRTVRARSRQEHRPRRFAFDAISIRTPAAARSMRAPLAAC